MNSISNLTDAEASTARTHALMGRRIVSRVPGVLAANPQDIRKVAVIGDG
jgi:hypothetical protein